MSPFPTDWRVSDVFPSSPTELQRGRQEQFVKGSGGFVAMIAAAQYPNNVTESVPDETDVGENRHAIKP